MIQEIKEVIYFSLGRTLKDIPESTPCPWDGGTTQKELLDFEFETDRLIVAADKMPGYGCTECGIKAWDPSTAIRGFVRAARIFNRNHDSVQAKYLMKEARLIKFGWEEKVQNS